MAGSILENLMSMLSPQVIGPAASQLGESQDTVNVGCKPERLRCSPVLQRRVGQPGFLSQIFGFITNLGEQCRRAFRCYFEPGFAGVGWSDELSNCQSGESVYVDDLWIEHIGGN